MPPRYQHFNRTTYTFSRSRTCALGLMIRRLRVWLGVLAPCQTGRAPVAASELSAGLLSGQRDALPLSGHPRVPHCAGSRVHECPPLAPRWFRSPPDRRSYEGLRLLPSPAHLTGTAGLSGGLHWPFPDLLNRTFVIGTLYFTTPRSGCSRKRSDTTCVNGVVELDWKKRLLEP